MPTPSPTPGPDDEAELGIGSTMISEKDGMTLVYVPEGKFKMGGEYDDEKPIHTVYLDAFWIDQTEVTNAMYKRCYEAGICKYPVKGAYIDSQQYSDHPVYVDWYRADAYCEWAGRRLPTEAEWEKAARGKNGRTYPWGEGIDSSQTNYDNNVGDTTAVGSYPDGVSIYGALDMAGNLWEWVADWYDGNYYTTSPDTNPTGPSSGINHVKQGGSWGSNFWGVRSASRNGNNPIYKDYYYGFRCADSHAP